MTFAPPTGSLKFIKIFAKSSISIVQQGVSADPLLHVVLSCTLTAWHTFMCLVFYHN